MPDYRLQHETESEFVEADPTGRYGRYNEVLGKGSSKIVYRAFDEIDGIEVAWYQVKVKDVLQTPEDLERLYSEVHLLKTLNHKNIIKFYSSWVDTQNRNINFITEMFTSGTLRQYRQKHKRVDITAVKNWSRQILRGLLYLHSHDPPIIHRDLKCDNIFINGNQGEVKIGDLGLAANLRKSRSAHSIIGTPEFMAPELYEEEYNELVDIYAFGMCLLEMITFEYPYSECSNPAQIYKKVTSGKKPACLYKVNDPEVRQFVEKCLATVSRRLPARELLMDPFLQEKGLQYCFSRLSSLGSLRYDMEEQMSIGRNLLSNVSQNGDNTTHKSRQTALPTSENWIAGHHEILKHHQVVPLPSGFEEEDLSHNVDFNVKVKKDDDTIFLRLRIADREGRIRNIYFPFDVEGDTAMSVAIEMVAQLDLADQDVTKIADIIDEEIMALVPNWKAGLAMDDHHPCANHNHCTTKSTENCCGGYNDRFSTVSSDSSLLEYLKSHCLVDNKCGSLPCTQVECAAMHGRFEEVTFQVDGTGLPPYVAEDIPTISTESSDVLHHHTPDWLAEGDPITPKSQVSHCSASPKSDDMQSCPGSSVSGNKYLASTGPLDLIEKTAYIEDIEEICRSGLSEGSSPAAQCVCFRSVHESQFTPPSPSLVDPLSNGYEDSVSRELKLLAAEHQQELMELKRKHEHAILEIKNRWKNREALGSSPNRNKISPEVNDQDCKIIMNGLQGQQEEDHETLYSTARDKKCVATNQRESDNGRGRYSGSNTKLSAKDPVSDPKKTVMKSSPPTRPENRNLGPNRRLMKMHSFGEVDSQLYINSVSTEIGRLKNHKTSVAHTTETSDNRKGARQIPPVPRSSTRDHKQGRTR